MSFADIALPTHIEIEPTETCNLRCRMCHVSYMPLENRRQLSAELIEKLADLRGIHVIIGSGFEPMMNKEFAAIVQKLAQFGSAIELVTNGTLLNEENVAALLDSDLREITFSFDGIREKTFEWIRRGASHTETIKRILEFRRKFENRSTLFAINSTMLRENLEEIPEMVEFWESHDFDMLRLISMVVREPAPELIQQSLYPITDQFYRLLDEAAIDVVENQRKLVLRSPYYKKSSARTKYPKNFVGDHVISNNPRARVAPMIRQEQQLGPGPGMTFPCRSPFTFARVLFNGDVQLCAQFSIGNLANESFHDIWFGEKAQRVRKLVAEETTICKSCDYFRFCLSSPDIDLEKRQNYFAYYLLELVDQIDFATGTISSSVPKKSPRLVDQLNGQSIVEYEKSYYVIPWTLGPVDLTTIDARNISEIKTAVGLREARRLASGNSIKK